MDCGIVASLQRLYEGQCVDLSVRKIFHSTLCPAGVLHALIGRGLSTIAFKISRGASKHGKCEDKDVMSHEYIAGLRGKGVKNARSNIKNNGKHGCQ